MTGFLSDNASGIHPAIADALVRADSGYSMPYGDDELSARLDETYSRLFETEVTVVPCVTGTAANGLSVALLAKSYNSICVQADAHIYLDECNAPEFFSGGARQIRIDGPDGKMDPANLQQALGVIGERHSAQPSAVSVAQATELGTVYRPAELDEIGRLVRGHGLGLHMDGARFANAVAALDCRPGDITWRLGVDILSFGATKNGCLAAEAIVLFDQSLAAEARYRVKQAGQLVSKQRYLAAQLLAYVDDGLWLVSARHANRQAAALASRLGKLDGVELLHPATTNTIYVRFPPAMVAALEAAGLAGYVYDNGYMRIVCSWATSDTEIDRFLVILGAGE